MFTLKSVPFFLTTSIVGLYNLNSKNLNQWYLVLNNNNCNFFKYEQQKHFSKPKVLTLSLFCSKAPQCSLATRQQRQQRVYNMMKDLQQKHLATLMQGEMSDRESTDMQESQNICRICHSLGDEPLITPCHCSGSTKHVHATCLLTWFKKAVKNTCELCRHKVAIRKKGRPYSEVSGSIISVNC